MRQLHRTSANCTSTALHKNGLALDRTRDVNRPMSGYTGNAKAGTLLQWHAFGKFNHLLQRNNRALGSGAERTVRLCAVAPHTPTDPLPRDTFAHRINRSRSIAMRNDTWIWHPDAKRIL